MHKSQDMNQVSQRWMGSGCFSESQLIKMFSVMHNGSESIIPSIKSLDEVSRVEIRSSGFKIE